MNIEKCKGKGCKAKETCWRYKSPKYKDTEYLSIPLLKDLESGCEYYWYYIKGRK